MIDYLNQTRYSDPHGDEYRFYLFTAKNGSSHISITVDYKDLARGKKMRGQECTGFSFGLPYKDGIIDWHAYDSVDLPITPIRLHAVSEEAKQFADRLIKLLVFV